jgi:hypothetical protein
LQNPNNTLFDKSLATCEAFSFFLAPTNMASTMKARQVKTNWNWQVAQFIQTLIIITLTLNCYDVAVAKSNAPCRN